MRKFALLFFVVVLIFTSCNKDVAPMALNFSSQINIHYNDIKIKGQVVFNPNNILELSVSSPSSLKGYTYKFKDDVLELIYNDLFVKAEKDYLPNNSFFKVLYNVLNSLKLKENYKLNSTVDYFAEYIGLVNNMDCIVRIEKSTGVIRKIYIEKINFTAEFLNVSIEN